MPPTGSTSARRVRVLLVVGLVYAGAFVYDLVDGPLVVRGREVSIVAPYSERYLSSVLATALVLVAAAAWCLAQGWRAELDQYLGEQLPAPRRRLNLLLASGIAAIFVSISLTPDPLVSPWRIEIGMLDVAEVLTWLLVLPLVQLILDIRAIAGRSTDATDPDDRRAMAMVAQLRRQLDRALIGLALTLTVWLAAKMAFYELLEAMSSSRPTLPSRLHLIVLANGILLSGLLALAFTMARAAIDAIAQAILEDKIEDLDWEGDLLGSRELRDAYAVELGLDLTVQARVQRGLLIATPLLAGMLSQLAS